MVSDSDYRNMVFVVQRLMARVFKVLVCGGRDYQDRELMFSVLDGWHARMHISLVIEGGQSGADRLAKEWAISRGVHHAGVTALWKTYGNSAGPIRNRVMLTLGPHMVIAFPGGKGTADMVRAAKEAEIAVHVIQSNNR